MRTLPAALLMAIAVVAEPRSCAVTLLEQAREAPVLEDPALGLAVRAVGHHVVLVEDGLQDRLAAWARLALVGVDLRRLGELLRERKRDLRLVDVEHALKLGDHRLAQRLRFAI